MVDCCRCALEDPLTDRAATRGDGANAHDDLSGRAMAAIANASLMDGSQHPRLLKSATC
jgi:hypothetical protein